MDSPTNSGITSRDGKSFSPCSFEGVLGPNPLGFYEDFRSFQKRPKEPQLASRHCTTGMEGKMPEHLSDKVGSGSRSLVLASGVCGTLVLVLLLVLDFAVLALSLCLRSTLFRSPSAEGFGCSLPARSLT